MKAIGLNKKAKPGTGVVEHYWFENEKIGLARARYHRFVIPLGVFDTGLNYVSQPEAPELTIEWVKVKAQDPANLKGISFKKGHLDGAEASVYLGSSHNWIDLDCFEISETSDGLVLRCGGKVDFEKEGVGQNERFEIQTKIEYREEV